MGGMGISKIKTNPVTDKLRAGQPAVGSWLTLCSPVAAESMASIGWDWLAPWTPSTPGRSEIETWLPFRQETP